MNTRASRRSPSPELPTPLLDALYRTYSENLEPVLDTQDMNTIMNPNKTVGFGHIRTTDEADKAIFAPAMYTPIERQDAITMDNARFHRMTMAWNELKGEPKRRKAKHKATPRKAKAKPKWIPRKKYLAKKRKAKLHVKRK